MVMLKRTIKRSTLIACSLSAYRLKCCDPSVADVELSYIVMSFVRPDVSQHFKTLQGFQMAYSVWQFMRTAKFFRLPYVLFSSLWHHFDSWIGTRKLIMMIDGIDVDKDPLSSNPRASWDSLLNMAAEGMTIVPIGEHNVEVSFDSHGVHTYLTMRHRAAHMALLLQNYLKLKLQFGRDDDLLWPKAHLIRRLNFEHAMAQCSAERDTPQNQRYHVSLITVPKNF